MPFAGAALGIANIKGHSRTPGLQAVPKINMHCQMPGVCQGKGGLQRLRRAGVGSTMYGPQGSKTLYAMPTGVSRTTLQ